MNSIYALIDPHTSEARYVGKTSNMRQRYASHCRMKIHTHVSRWVQSLRRDGRYPEMVLLEGGLSDSEWPEAEQFWISYLKGLGANLTNITAGGHHVVSKSPVLMTLGYPVPALYENEMCVCRTLPNGDSILLFTRLSGTQLSWVVENEKRCKAKGFTLPHKKRSSHKSTGETNAA